MKKLNLFAIILLSLVMISCEKEKGDEENKDYYLTCDVDGVPSDFSALMYYKKEWGVDYTAAMLGGFANTTTNTSGFGFVIINIPSGDSITAQTYIETNSDFEILGSYENPVTLNDPFYEAGTTVYNNALDEGVSITNHFTVTITEINLQHIKGTFSGDFYFDGDPTGEKKTITNGKFYIPYTP